MAAKPKKKAGSLLAAVQKASRAEPSGADVVAMRAPETKAFAGAVVTDTDVPGSASAPDQTPEPARTSSKQRSSQAPSRKNTRLIAGHFDPEVARQLRMLAAEDDTTIQELLREALDLLFAKKGKTQIASLMQPQRHL